jgi:hypothetical protein
MNATQYSGHIWHAQPPSTIVKMAVQELQLQQLLPKVSPLRYFVSLALKGEQHKVEGWPCGRVQPKLWHLHFSERDLYSAVAFCEEREPPRPPNGVNESVESE